MRLEFQKWLGKALENLTGTGRDKFLAFYFIIYIFWT